LNKRSPNSEGALVLSKKSVNLMEELYSLMPISPQLQEILVINSWFSLRWKGFRNTQPYLWDFSARKPTFHSFAWYYL